MGTALSFIRQSFCPRTRRCAVRAPAIITMRLGEPHRVGGSTPLRHDRAGRVSIMTVPLAPMTVGVAGATVPLIAGRCEGHACDPTNYAILGVRL